MDKILNHNPPIIDNQVALRMAGNKKDLAFDLLSILIKGLPESLKVINENLDTQNFIALSEQLHKLLGACNYCGVMRLKNAILHFQSLIKTQQTEGLSEAFKLLKFEIHQLTEEASKLGAVN